MIQLSMARKAIGLHDVRLLLVMYAQYEGSSLANPINRKFCAFDLKLDDNYSITLLLCDVYERERSYNPKLV